MASLLLLLSLATSVFEECRDQATVAATIWCYERRLVGAPNAQAYLELGKLHLREDSGDDGSRAIAALSDAVRVAPDAWEAHFALGHALLKNGQPDAAIASYAKSLRLKPGYKEAEEAIADAIDIARAWDKDVKTAASPDSVAALAQLDLCTNGTGLPAVAACKRAIKIGLSRAQAVRAYSSLAEVIEPLDCDDAASVDEQEAARELAARLQATTTRAIPKTLPSLPAAQRMGKQGLLLGLRGWGTSVQTLWITSTDGHPAVSAVLDGILVPRPDGFWQIPPDSLQAHRLGEQPRTPLAAADTEGWNCDSTNWHKLTFVSPSHVGYEGGGESTCGAHPSADHFAKVVPFLGLADTQEPHDVYMPPIEINDLIPSVSERALRRAANVFIASKRRNGLYLVADELRPENWMLIRRRGRWAVRGVLDGDRGYHESFDVPVQAPRTVAPTDALVVPWATITETVPAAIDAVSSPWGTLLAVLTNDELLVFPVSGGRMYAPTRYSRPPGHPADPVGTPVILMAEWARGAYVDAWTDAVADARRTSNAIIAQSESLGNCPELQEARSYVAEPWCARRPDNNRMQLTGGGGCSRGPGSPFGEPLTRSRHLEPPPAADPCVVRTQVG